MLFRNFFPLPPLADASAPGNRTAQRLADTGATESSTKRALIVGKVHLILVGAEGVRLRFSGTPGTASAVDNTRDMVLGPWQIYPFTPEAGLSTYVYAEAADGTDAYECFVVQYQS